MTIDKQLEMFTAQAAWLEREYSRLLRQRKVRWDRLAELRMRNAQLTREFFRFMENHSAENS